MIVVSNTSSLPNLASIGQVDLLRRLYAKVAIAEGVWLDALRQKAGFYLSDDLYRAVPKQTKEN